VLQSGVVAVVFNLLEIVKYYYDTIIMLVGTKVPETGFTVV
jgi:hypothetical protein